MSDEEGERERKAVFAMISKAADYGLLTEVVLQFGYERSEGQETKIACQNALSEWDIE